MTERPPLLLIPGLLCTEALFAQQLPILERLAVPRVVMDQTRYESIGEIAGAILTEAPPRFALVALSMGGYVALEIMRRAPERILRLALLDTSARSDTLEQSSRRRGLIQLAEMGEFKGVTPRLLPLLVHPARLEDSPLCEAIIAMAAEVGKAAFIRQQKAIMGRIDSRGDLIRIACPTMILVGRQDSLTPLAHAEEMAALIPGAQLEIIEDCGHMSTMEKPRSTAAALERWFVR